MSDRTEVEISRVLFDAKDAIDRRRELCHRHWGALGAVRGRGGSPRGAAAPGPSAHLMSGPTPGPPPRPVGRPSAARGPDPGDPVHDGYALSGPSALNSSGVVGFVAALREPQTDSIGRAVVLSPGGVVAVTTPLQGFVPSPVYYQIAAGELALNDAGTTLFVAQLADTFGPFGIFHSSAQAMVLEGQAVTAVTLR